MGTLVIRRESGPSRIVHAAPLSSVLNALSLEGLPIRHACGGKAECGTCRIRVVSAKGLLSAVGGREAARLAAVGAAPDERLACQTYVAGELELEIVLPVVKDTP
ncbi:MAG: 2Fe-2S iron-sulfur cluster-binding protein [Spirochaetes bacterium]|nr:2Fe-2S iron-sulfur cluster-binding protein [Spirochaetota bacterium]